MTMGIDDIIREQPEYRQVQQQEREQETTQTPAGTIQVNVDPLFEWERQTVEFWLLVAQTALLAYIAWKL